MKSGFGKLKKKEVRLKIVKVRMPHPATPEMVKAMACMIDKSTK